MTRSQLTPDCEFLRSLPNPVRFVINDRIRRTVSDDYGSALRDACSWWDDLVLRCGMVTEISEVSVAEQLLSALRETRGSRL